MASRNQLIYRCWRDIQDIIGRAAQWPFQVRRLFWSSGLRHWDRIIICTFCFVNGLIPIVFSSPEPKAQVSLSDDNLSVVRRCRCRRKLFTFSSSSPEPLISTKLGTKHPWVKGIEVCSNEGPRPFQGEIITK